MQNDDAEVEFPILCEPCLGTNPYMRMTTQEGGKECKICSRPYKTYRWLPGAGQRYRRTEICTSCAKVKNVCQGCILDLEYGLSTRVRDAMLGMDALPHGDANRKWALRVAEDNIAKSGKSLIDYNRIESVAKETLKKLSRSSNDPYPTQRNVPQIPGVCNLWLKGKCHRGKDCPYKHELPKRTDAYGNPLGPAGAVASNQAPGKQILERHIKEAQAAQADSSTILVTKLPESCTDQTQLTEFFGRYGEVKSVVLSVAKRCAFVNFVDRFGAQAAIEAGEEQDMDGATVTVAWGKNRLKTPASTPTAKSNSQQNRQNRFEYSSMNPSLLN